MHEAALGVLQLTPELFWPFSAALFAHQREYFDESVAAETRNQTYRRLAKLGASVGVDEAALFGLLKVDEGEKGGKEAHNKGNKVTDDLKVLVKTARLVGVHVSPTVIVDGVVNNEISSGWGEKEWVEWLEKNIK